MLRDLINYDRVDCVITGCPARPLPSHNKCRPAAPRPACSAPWPMPTGATSCRRACRSTVASVPCTPAAIRRLRTPAPSSAPRNTPSSCPRECCLGNSLNMCVDTRLRPAPVTPVASTGTLVPDARCLARVARRRNARRSSRTRSAQARAAATAVRRHPLRRPFRYYSRLYRTNS